MDRKLKGIPVYAIVLILVSGTALGAGIWFLTVDVPVEYDEPVQITMYSERDYDAQYGGGDADFRLRDQYEHEEPADLTYESFHQYITFDNPDEGVDNLEVTVSLEVQDLGDDENDIGFVVLDDEVDPVDVSWEYDSEEEEWRANGELVVRETHEFSRTLEADGALETTVTVIYTNRNRTGEEGDPYDVDGANIEWFFEDTTE